MLRSRLILMTALLAVAGIMATMAYTTAEVRNPASATIVSTNVALLALNCLEGVGNKDEACEVKADGRLHLDFARGLQVDGTPGRDPVPGVKQPTIVAVEYEVKNDKGNRYYLVTLTHSNGDSSSFATRKHSAQISNFQYSIRGDEPRCLDYSYRAGGKNQTGSHCLAKVQETPDDPGEPGTPGKTHYGFQPGSTYTFNELVWVTNNSEDNIEIGVNLTGAIVEASGLEIEVTGEGNRDFLAGATQRLAPGDTTFISFSFNVPDEWGVPDKFANGDEQYPFAGEMIVTGVAVP